MENSQGLESRTKLSWRSIILSSDYK